MSPDASPVFSLRAAPAGSLALAGGKAVGLHALLELGLPVPDGCCVSADAFRAALTEAGLQSLLAAGDALDPADVAAVRAHAARVREAVLALPLPPALQRALLQHWQEGLAGAPVAVRSSATAEDLEDASFAGQQDTVLGVTSGEALLAAVRRCWASLFSDRALTYRLHRGVSSAEAAMGVVVQRMVEAEVAGVLFTADPATGHRGVVTLEAVPGLGEALVSGHALPDTYRVSKTDGVLLEARPGAGRTQPLLSPEVLAHLVALGRQVEVGRGLPQDVEWAVADGRCWLLQARAITTLNPLPSPASADGHWHVYVSFGHMQVNTAPLSPLTLSLFRRLIPIGRDAASGDSAVLKEAGARMYADCTPLLASPRLGGRFTGALRSMSPQVAERLERARERPELAASARALAVSPVPLLRRVVPMLLRSLWLAPQAPARMARNYAAALDALAEAQRVQVEREEGAARLVAVDAVLHGVFERLMFRLAGPVIPLLLGGERLLRHWTRTLAPHLPEDALLRGLEGNVVTEMDLGLGDLADLARPVPALREALTSTTPAEALEALRGHTVAAAFFRAWDDFLARYGQRCAGELDVALPRWREEPSGLLRSVAALLERAPGAHRAQQAAARERAARALAEMVAAARRGPLGGLRARWVAFVVGRVRVLLGLREHHKAALTHLLALVRRECLAAGARLAAAGALGRAGDVWMLTLPELVQAARALEREGRVDGLRTLVAAREREHARARRWSPPPVLTSDGEALAPRAAAAAPAGTYVGTPVSSGVVEGVVRVVEDPNRETLAPGEVLVAASTDPGWTPLFMHAAGLVMEVGGTMTHGSVVARELGIPAVVAVDGATRLLRTGQRVRVDGERGWVTVLDTPPAQASGTPEAA